MQISAGMQKLIVFKLESEEFAVSVLNIKSIERVSRITRVPNNPHFVKGVINLRSIVTPVIDLRERFHHKPTEFTEETRIIIINVEEINVGLIVDEANNVIDINTDSIEPAPDVVGSNVVEYISGVVKIEDRLLILLDLQKVLSNSELAELKAMEG